MSWSVSVLPIVLTVTKKWSVSNMTTEQAIAILEAERVLQDVGCNGPDCNPGSAWHDYVQEAGRTVQSDTTVFETFSDLDILEDSDD